MKRLSSLLSIAALFLAGASAFGQEKPPAWAYPVNPPDFKVPPDDGTPRKVPDSNVTLTLTQVAICSFRRTGIRPITLRSQTRWRAGANLTCTRAVFVTVPTVLADRKMRT